MPKTLYQIVSTPKSTANKEVSDYTEEHHFGFFETPHARAEQEDALCWKVLESKDLTPTGTSNQLTPNEIAHRLWTSYQLLDQYSFEQQFHGGTTASTTIYDGKGNLITATLADAAAFAALYDKSGMVLGVVRLNSKTHKPTDPTEAKRIAAAGGIIVWGRVDGALAISRAIGDHEFKAHGVCSEATIDSTDVVKIAEQLQIKLEDIGKMQIITTCDGFTDAAEGQTKENHEQFLLDSLQKMDFPGATTEAELAKALIIKAKPRSHDNITVAIQSIGDIETSQAFLLGVYDGHAGSDVSSYVAENIARIFIEQCSLDFSVYAKQDLSIYAKIDIYNRDNPETAPTLFAVATPSVDELPRINPEVLIASPVIDTTTPLALQEIPTFTFNRIVAVSASVDEIQLHLRENPLLAPYLRVPRDIEGLKIKLEKKYQFVDATEYVPLEIADHVPAQLILHTSTMAGAEHKSIFNRIKVMRIHHSPLFLEFSGLIEVLEKFRKDHDKKVTKFFHRIFGSSSAQEQKTIQNAIEHLIEFIKTGKTGLTEQDKALLNKGELRLEINSWEMKNGKFILELFNAHDRQFYLHALHF